VVSITLHVLLFNGRWREHKQIDTIHHKRSTVPHSVAINQFEGPLGLLLELVERKQLPITEIAVGAITSEYLESIAKLDGLSAEELSDFLALGARLIYIKSLALLPTVTPDEQSDELRQLEVELGEYRRFVTAAGQLRERAKRPSFARQIQPDLAAEDLPAPNIALSDLAAAFQAALQRVPALPEKRVMSASSLSQADVCARLTARLKTGSFALHELLASLHDRLEVVVTFSAVLELIRSSSVRVTQASQFDAIMVEAA
jgi:segregation and condensation protein A